MTGLVPSLAGLRRSVRLAVFVVLAGLSVLIGCAPSPNSSEEPGTGRSDVAPEAGAVSSSSDMGFSARNRGNPMVGGGDITPILATTVLNPGEQRVSFLLAGPRAIIKAPTAQVTATFLDGSENPGSTTQQAQAVFHGWPFGIRGAYTTRLNFDQPGHWQLEVSVDDGEFNGSAVIDLEVLENAPIPAIGQRPPASVTKTLADVASVEELTTDYRADEDLYRLTVAEAIDGTRPAVIVFASPTFCTSPTCGPQVDTVKELKADYQERVGFVHVEIYDNPQEIQGDLDRAEVVPAVAEWGFTQLPHWTNESWVYVVNDEGLVVERFEGYVTRIELEETLRELLEEI